MHLVNNIFNIIINNIVLVYILYENLCESSSPTKCLKKSYKIVTEDINAVLFSNMHTRMYASIYT